MVAIVETAGSIRLRGYGRLPAWLGPALRGIVAGRYKSRVCRHSPVDQNTVWKYCKGCPHLPECSYGQLFEPDASQAGASPFGLDDALRPIVLAPRFPVREQARPGQRIFLRLLLIGPAADYAGEVWRVLADAAGAGACLGPQRIPFEVVPPPCEGGQRRYRLEVPHSLDAGDVVERIRVRLTAPLFLKQEVRRGKKRMLGQPTFLDLFRASLRTVGRCLALYGNRLPDGVYRELKSAAEAVPTLTASYRRFRQGKWSNRSRQHLELVGVVGEAEFGPVPSALITWLCWGGILGVGNHRVAGAGRWEVEAVRSAMPVGT